MSPKSWAVRISFYLGVIAIAIGIWLYRESRPSGEENAEPPAQAELRALGLDEVSEIRETAKRFVEALNDGRFEEACSLMTPQVGGWCPHGPVAPKRLRPRVSVGEPLLTRAHYVEVSHRDTHALSPSALIVSDVEMSPTVIVSGELYDFNANGHTPDGPQNELARAFLAAAGEGDLVRICEMLSLPGSGSGSDTCLDEARALVLTLGSLDAPQLMTELRFLAEIAADNHTVSPRRIRAEAGRYRLETAVTADQESAPGRILLGRSGKDQLLARTRLRDDTRLKAVIGRDGLVSLDTPGEPHGLRRSATAGRVSVEELAVVTVVSGGEITVTLRRLGGSWLVTG